MPPESSRITARDDAHAPSPTRATAYRPSTHHEHEPAHPPAGAAPPAWCCPTCRGALHPHGAAALTCQQGHEWRIVDGIPRFVPRDNYAAAFGAQWRTYRRTQLDSHTGHPISAERLRRCVGPALEARLGAPGTRQVLEVGCGAGRFTEVLLATGASVTSVDLSEAVDANQQNFPQSACHRIAQADVYALPFTPGQFDVVFCLGVVQHTPDPGRTLARLYEQVRPGGWLVVDHYARDVGWALSLKPLYRAVLKRLTPAAGLVWTHRLVDAFLPLHARLHRNRLAHRLLGRVSPVMHYYAVYPLDETQQREWALLDTHDSLTDWYKHRRTPVELRELLGALGATAIWCEPGGIGVEARCRRPGAGV